MAAGGSVTVSRMLCQDMCLVMSLSANGVM